ncbi:hypothetical protein ABFS82_01G015900 [Erythranthe guttata]
MKRGKDEEKSIGPMFPRLHVNDTEKGGPRAPPRNKMALYEQLSIPSQRYSRSMLPYTANNNGPANLVPPSSQCGGNEREMFLNGQVPPRHQSEHQFKHYSDLSTQLAQVEQRKKSDEDECRVPVFIHPMPSKRFNKYNNNTDREKLSPSILQERCSEPLGQGNLFSNSKEALPSEDVNTVHDLSHDAVSGEDGPCRPTETGLERGDSVSETSVLEAVNGVNITPDDVVGVIGQKQFFKARTAIANQQRAFAVQVFELHRLIKVQRLIAASPHLLLEDSPYFNKPTKASSPANKPPLDYTAKSIPDIPNRKGDDSYKPIQEKECSAENTVEKTSLSTQTNPCFHQQPQGHQWLIPVMSPSEGLVYKPYPFVSQPCGGGCGPPGSNPTVGNFSTPPPPQYHHLPSFPQFPPHGYFPPYCVPIMDTSAFSGPPPEQTIRAPAAAGPAVQKSGPALWDVEMQGSTASSPSGRRKRGSNGVEFERRNMLPLFPTTPAAVDALKPTRVIKVVPRNGLSASESAARIFRTIQEEREQYNSM